MSKKTKKLIKRGVSLFIALALVLSLGLSISSDRVLHATALSDEDTAEESGGKSGNVTEAVVNLTLPEEKPAKESAADPKAAEEKPAEDKPEDRTEAVPSIAEESSEEKTESSAEPAAADGSDTENTEPVAGLQVIPSAEQGSSDGEKSAEETVSGEDAKPEETETTENTGEEYADPIPGEEEEPAEEVENSEEETEGEEILEEESEEEEPEEKETEEEEAYPAQELQTTASDGSTIVIRAPQGCLPKGSTVSASLISSARAANAIEGTLSDETELVDLVVYDIVIRDAEGNEIQPRGAVHVSIHCRGIKAGDAASVYHITDGGYAEKVGDASSASSVSFNASSFSPYAVATTVSSDTSDDSSVAVGETLQLTAPSGYSSSSISWSSGNKKIATVSSSGLVTGVAPGTVTITCKASMGFGISFTVATYTITVREAKQEPSISITPTTVSLTEIGQTASLLAKLTGMDSENVIVWESSDPTVVTVDNGVVTALRAGSTTITASVSPEEDDLYGSTYFDTASVTVQFAEYDLYHYALIPGADANSSVGSGDTRWFGIGATKISGVNSPSTYSLGTVLNNYIVGAQTKSLFPRITYENVTYTYDASGSGEYGTYTVQPFRVTVSAGANSGYNGYNPTVSGSTKTFHLDYICVLNEANNYSVSFAVKYPQSSQPEALTDYAQRVREGTELSQLRIPSASDVPETMTSGGISYRLDGWYTDAGFTQAADFSGTITSNTTFYARYFPTNARYRVEYYYDGVMDSSLTDVKGPVSFGTEISHYTDKTKTGFVFSEVQPSVLVVGEDESQNIIRVYYTKRLVSYRVGYYLKGNGESIAPSVTASVRYGETGIGVAKEIEGYTLASAAEQQLVIDSAGMEIRFEYYKNVNLKAASGSFSYDGSAHEVSGYLSSVPGVVFEGIEATGVGTNAGSYTVAFTGNPVGKTDAGDRYLVVSVESGMLTIARLQATVTAADSGKAYGEADPVLTASVNGTLPGEEGLIRYTLTRAPGEDVGTYAISCEGETEQGNYEVSFRGAEFTIERAGVLNIHASGYEGVYDGNSHAVNATPSVENGTVLTYSVDGGTTWTAEVPEIQDVGEITVLIKAENPNYVTANAEALLKVTPRTVTVQPADAGKTYGESDPDLKAVVEGLVGEDEIVYSLSRKEGENVGSYAITVSADENQGNYTVQTGNAVFTITAASMTSEALSQQKTYDGTALTGGAAGEYPDGTVISFSTDGGETWSAEAPSITGAGSLTYSLRAENPNYSVSYAEGVLTVMPRSILLRSESAEKEYDGTALTAKTVSVEGEGFADGEGAEYTVSGSQTLVGMSENRFNYSFAEGTDAANYTVETSFGTLTVKNREAKYQITVKGADRTATYNGQKQSASGLAETVFTINGNDYTVTGLTAETEQINAGTYEIPVSGTPVVLDAQGNDVTENFSVSVESGIFNIRRRGVELSSASVSKHYDGTPLNTSALDNKGVTIGGEGFAPGEGVIILLNGSQTLPGESDNSFTLSFAENTNVNNYDITTRFGRLSVVKRDAEERFRLTVEAVSAETVYDGEIQSVNGLLETSFIVNGQPYTVADLDASGEGQHAGEYPVTVSGTARVLDGSGNDVTESFVVETRDGTLRIRPRSLRFVSASMEKEYDGTVLTSERVTVEGDGFAPEEGASYRFEAGQMLPGSSANRFAYTFWENTSADDYRVTVEEGILRVFDREILYSITAQANGGEALYDGQEHTVSGLVKNTFVLNGNSYTLSGLSAEVSGTEAGRYPVVVTGTPVVLDAEGNDVTGQFAVDFRDGMLEIRARSLVLVSASAEKEYDGSALTAPTVTVEGDGFVEGEGMTYSFSGSQTLVGSSANRFEYDFQTGTKTENYSIRCEYGTLTVMNREAKYRITVQAKSAELPYSGKEQRASGLEETSFLMEGRYFSVNGLEASGEGLHAGSYSVSITGTPRVLDEDGNDVSDQFAVQTQSGELRITPRTLRLISASMEKEYDGTILTSERVTVEGDGFAPDEGANYRFEAGQLIPGSSANRFTYSFWENTSADDYRVIVEEGVLHVFDRVVLYSITALANSGEALYDGQEHSTSGLAETSFVLNGNSYTLSGLSAEVSGTDAGYYPVIVTGTPIVLDAEGNDVTGQFAVDFRDGMLEIRARSMVLVSASAEKEYDGSALTAPTVTVEGDGFAEGEGMTYRFTGSQTLVGSSANRFSYDILSGTKADNYSIRCEYGTLTVMNREAKYGITVRASSSELPYSGKEQRVSGLEETNFHIDGRSYSVVGLEASGTGLHAGSYPVSVTGTPRILDENGNDVSEQFAVQTQSGELRITPRVILLESLSAAKSYDGLPLTTANLDNQGISVFGDDFAEAEGLIFTLEGSQTLAGESENRFSYRFREGTEAGDYSVSTRYGTLTVTNRTAEERFSLTVSAGNENFLYDGMSHRASELHGTELELNGVRYRVVGLHAEAEAVNAGTYPVAIEGTASVFDGNGADVTENFELHLEEGTLTILRRQITLRSATVSKEYDGNPLTSDTVTAEGDGFASGEGANYTVTGSQTIAGSSSNDFSYILWDNTLPENYSISTVPGRLYVSNREAAFEIDLHAQSLTVGYDGNEHSVAGFVEDSFEIGGNLFRVDGLTASASATDAGSYPVRAGGTLRVLDEAGRDVTSQFVVTCSDGTLTILRRQVTLRSASQSKEYDGAALSNTAITVEGEGFAAGEGASYSVSGSQTLPGISENRFAYTLQDNTKADNYDITQIFGTLTVTNRNTRYAVEVEAQSGDAMYDGTEHYVDGLKSTRFGIGSEIYRISGLEAHASAVHAGSYPVLVTGTPVVLDSRGNDVTEQFAVTTKDGTLQIGQRSVSIRSDDATRVYDGYPLTAETIRVSGDGFVPGEGMSFAVTGSRTLVGSSANSFRYTFNEGTNPADYRVTQSYGTLTVLNRPDDARFEVHVKAQSGSALYDGQTHSVSGLIAEGATAAQGEALTIVQNGQSYTISGLSASRSETSAGSYTVNVTGTPFVRDENGNDVTAQFLVLTENGTLTISRRSVTLRSDSASHAYNGRELRAERVFVEGDGFAQGEGAQYTVTGSRTLVGESENSFTYVLSAGTDAGNYDIRQVYGTLCVTNRDAKYLLTVRANSMDALYDGTVKRVEGLVSTNFEIGGVQYTIEGLNAEATGTDAGEYYARVSGTAQVLDENGNDVTAQFAVQTEDGILCVLPRHVLLRSSDATKEYDGYALSDPAVFIEEDGFAPGEGAEYYSFASRILVGSSDNSFNYSLLQNTKESNYEITTVFGRLNIVNREVLYRITLHAKSDTVFYDGRAHSVEGFENLTFLVAGRTYTVEGIRAYVSGTAAGRYPVEITGEARVVDENGADVTDQFAVVVINGTLTIRNTYVLRVHFVDENGTPVAESFVGRYAPGAVFGPIYAPQIDGMIPDYRVVYAPEGGMPARDLELYVTYHADVPAGPGTGSGPENGGSGPLPEKAGVVNADDDDIMIEEIADSQVPLSAAPAGYWALLNLIMALICVLLALVLILRQIGERHSEEDEERKASAEDETEPKRHDLIWLIVSIVLAVASVIAFFLTEDMTNSMRLVDRWTILMLVLLVAQALVTYCAMRQKEKEPEEE